MGIPFWLYANACFMCALALLSPDESARWRFWLGWGWFASGVYTLAVSFFS